MQHGMLVHSLCDSRPGMFLVQSAFRVPEIFDAGVLQEAWDSVVQRHPILRGSLNWDAYDEPRLEIARTQKLPFHSLYCGGLSRAEFNRVFDDYLSTDRRAGFNLRRGRLLRVTLLQLRLESLLLVTFHHTVLDTRSLGKVVEEVLTTYDAMRRGTRAHLGEVLPFSEYVDWVASLPKEPAERYWRDRLRGFTQPTSLVIREREITDGETKHSEVEVRLSAHKTATLEQFARNHKLTVYSVLQCTWGLMLSDLAECEDVVFGLVRACREETFPPLAQMVGPAINTVPVRIQCDRSMKVLVWLQATRAQQLADRPYEQTALTDIKAWSEVPGTLPLFDSIMNLGFLPLSASTLARYAKETPTADMFGETNYGLTIKGYHGRQLVLKAAHDENRYDAAAVKEILQHLLGLLETVISRPDEDLRTVLSLNKSERAATLNIGSAAGGIRSAKRRSIGLSD